MKFELNSSEQNVNKIQSYSRTGFKIQNTIHDTHIVISRTRLLKNHLCDTFDMFAMQHLDGIITWKPEIILLGTGSKLIIPTENFTAYVNKHAIGFEVMDTGAACRSYNVLIDEGRDVVACLFLKDT